MRLLHLFFLFCLVFVFAFSCSPALYELQASYVNNNPFPVYFDLYSIDQSIPCSPDTVLLYSDTCFALNGNNDLIIPAELQNDTTLFLGRFHTEFFNYSPFSSADSLIFNFDVSPPTILRLLFGF